MERDLERFPGDWPHAFASTIPRVVDTTRSRASLAISVSR